MDNQKIINRVKSVLGFRKDYELAETMGVSAMMLSSWKRSKGKLVEEIIRFGVKSEMDFNEIFYIESKIESSNTSVLMAEDLFSYYLNPKETLIKLPKYKIPKIGQTSVGFQVISQNMEPTLLVSSIVFADEITVNNLNINDIYVLIVVDKGIYTSRYLSKSGTNYIFKNDNVNFPDVTFSEDRIKAIFKVNGLLSKLE